MKKKIALCERVENLLLEPSINDSFRQLQECHQLWKEIGRVKYDVIDDEETVDAFFMLSRLEGIIPAIESSHAVAYGMKLAKTMDKGSVLINLSGRGDKDMDYIIEYYGIR